MTWQRKKRVEIFLAYLLSHRDFSAALENNFDYVWQSNQRNSICHPLCLLQLFPLACAFFYGSLLVFYDFAKKGWICILQIVNSVWGKDNFAESSASCLYEYVRNPLFRFMVTARMEWIHVQWHEPFPLTEPLNDFRFLRNMLFCIPLLNPLQSFYYSRCNLTVLSLARFM